MANARTGTPNRGMGQGLVEVSVNTAGLGSVLRSAKEFDPQLRKALAKRIRDAAKPMADASKRKVLEAAPESGRGLSSKGHGRVKGTRKTKGVTVAARTDVRSSIAKGIGIRVNTRGPGSVSIVADDRYLPAERRKMTRAYNKATWRHPVFGNRSVWRTQHGNPYFEVVLTAKSGDVERAIQTAINDAIRTIENI